MPDIFISYRRSDSVHITGRIDDHLVAKYTRKQVFKDFDSITLGVSFPLRIERMLKRSKVALVVIGPDWLTTKDEKGRRRLDDPNDSVRLEVEIALRANMHVIPLLVFNAHMPRESELPPSIRSLSTRAGMSIRDDPDFRNDMARLFKTIDLIPPRPNPAIPIVVPIVPIKPDRTKPITVVPIKEPIKAIKPPSTSAQLHWGYTLLAIVLSVAIAFGIYHLIEGLKAPAKGRAPDVPAKAPR